MAEVSLTSDDDNATGSVVCSQCECLFKTSFDIAMVAKGTNIELEGGARFCMCTFVVSS